MCRSIRNKAMKQNLEECMDFKTLLQTAEYDFIRSNERLGKRILILGVGGS